MLTIECLIRKNRDKLGECPAFIDHESELSYDELLNSIWTTAKYFKDHGVEANMRVGVLGPASIDYLITLLALWHIKAVTCPLNIRFPLKTIQSQLDNIQANYLVTSLEDVLDSEVIITKKIYLYEATQNPSLDFDQDDNQNLYFPMDQELTVLYTSGSSAEPKAVVHSFGNHYYSALGANEHIVVDESSRWLFSLPICHVGGLSILFKTLLGRGSVVIPSVELNFSEVVEQKNITHVSLVPTQLIRLIEDPQSLSALKKLKAVLVGGASISELLAQRCIEEKLPIYVTYGSTEMSSQIATTDRIKNLDDLSKVKILNYRYVRMADDNEIQVKGEALFQGYLKSNKLERPFDEEGWFSTGDLGEQGPAENFRIIGRKDNMFISGGENIQPEEIEKYLLKIEGVEQAVVVPINHLEFGKRPVGFLKLKRNTALTKNSIMQLILENLPKFKVPDQFYLLQGSAVADSLKISRSRLLELIENNSPDLKIFD